MMILSLGSLAQAQKDTMTSGRLTIVPVAEINHLLSVQEMSDIMDTIIRGNVDTKKWYTLSDGFKLKIPHPTEWLELILRCYRVIDIYITKENLVDAINASYTALSNGSMSPTRNYYWGPNTKINPNGKIAFMDDYNWSYHKDIPVIVYKGYPVIKRSCGNPQLLCERIETTPVVDTTPVPVISTPTDNTNVTTTQQQPQQQKVITTGQTQLTSQSGAVNNDLPNNNQQVVNNNGNGNTWLHAASGAVNSVYGPYGGGYGPYGGQRIIMIRKHR